MEVVDGLDVVLGGGGLDEVVDLVVVVVFFVVVGVDVGPRPKMIIYSGYFGSGCRYHCQMHYDQHLNQQSTTTVLDCQSHHHHQFVACF